MHEADRAQENVLTERIARKLVETGHDAVQVIAPFSADNAKSKLRRQLVIAYVHVS